LYAGEFASTITVLNNDAAVVVGNYYTGSSNVSTFSIAAVLETNIQLTPDQHAQVYAELQSRVWPQRPGGRTTVDMRVNPHRANLVWAPQLHAPPAHNVQVDALPAVASNNAIVDASPFGRHAKIHSTHDLPLYQVDAIGGSYQYRGTYHITANAGLTWTKANDFTMVAVVRPDSFFNYPAVGGLNAYWTMYFTEVTPTTASLCHYNGVSDFVCPGVTILKDHLYFLANVVNPDNSVSFYVDGKFVATVAGLAGGFGLSTFVAGSNGGYDFWGKIYRCEIYDLALTAQEVQDLFVQSRLKAVGYKSDWGVPVSSAARGGTIGTELESTGWRFSDTTGRWFVDTSTVQGQPVKTIRCSTGGANVALYRDSRAQGESAQDAAYGTWDMTLTIPAASGINWHFVTTISTILAGAGGNNGYAVQASATGAISIYRMTSGVIAAAIKETAAGFLTTSVPYSLRVTRDFKGLWTAKVLGGAYSVWTELPDTGAGPFVNPDNTYTASNYQVLGALTGLVVSLGTRAGNFALSKQLK
jgi:hypothetical protein